MRNPEKQFTDAFERYADDLFRHCVLRLSDRERAAELIQDTFLRSLEYVKQGEEILDMRAFLYRTLRNLIIDEYRKKKSVSLEAMLETKEEYQADIPDESLDLLEEAMDRFDSARALRALRALPEPYREALVLRYNESLSLKEVADICGESENTVSVRIHRGLKKLREIMENHE